MFTTTFRRTPFAVFAPDSGAGTGGGANPDGQDPDGGAGQDPNDGAGQDPNDGDGQDPPADKDPDEIDGIKKADVTPAVWSALVAAKRAVQIAEANKTAANKQAAKLRIEAQKAEEARLAADKKFEELAETRRKRLEEVEPQLTELEAKVQAYEAVETKRIAAEVKDWPKEIRELVDGAAGIEAKRQIVDKLRPTVEKATAAPPPKGTGRDPKGSGGEKRTITAPIDVRARL